MDTASDCSRSVRSLHPWEVDAARLVFAGRLAYEKVRIHECNPFPNWINRMGHRLKGMEAPHTHNAITLGNHVFFPVRLPENPVRYGDPEYYKLSWLIHELTHAYQYQKYGWSYLYKAVRTQLTEKAAAYNYGGKTMLKQRREEGWKFHHFNLEQQGDICRDYFDCLQRGEEDLEAWRSYLEDIWDA